MTPMRSTQRSMNTNHFLLCSCEDKLGFSANKLALLSDIRRLDLLLLDERPPDG